MASPNLTPSTSDYDMLEALDAQPPENKLQVKRARVSKTRNWKQIDEYIDGRITAYRDYAPGVNPAIHGTEADWRVADCIVKELVQLRKIVDDITNGVS